MRVKRALIITIASIALALLFIILIQTGLGVDSEVTLRDSNRPEIVGED